MIGVIKLLLYFLVVPVVLGEILGAVGRDRMPWIVRYSSGYLAYIALFWVVCFPSVRRQVNRAELTHHWILCVRIIGIMALGIWLALLISKRLRLHVAGMFPTGRLKLAVIGIGLITIALAVFFLTPHVQDTTAAAVRLALDKKKIVLRDPYTAWEIGDGIWRSFLPLFYMTGAALTDLSPHFVVQYLLPVVMLPVFYGIWSRTGRYLFFGDEDKYYCFMLLIEVFYLCMTLKEVYIGMAAFQNIWNPETVLVSCILPCTFVLSLELSEFAAGKFSVALPEDRRSYAEESAGMIVVSAVLLLCCFPAAQLCITRGAAAVVFTAGVTGIANFVRILHREKHRGVTNEH